MGYPILIWLGVSHPVLAGGQDCCTPRPGTGVPSGKDIGPVEVLWDGDGVPLERTWNQWTYYGMEMGLPPPGGGQTENITSCRTTYAGGKNPVKFYILKSKIQIISKFNLERINEVVFTTSQSFSFEFCSIRYECLVNCCRHSGTTGRCLLATQSQNSFYSKKKLHSDSSYPNIFSNF